MSGHGGEAVNGPQKPSPDATMDSGRMGDINNSNPINNYDSSSSSSGRRAGLQHTVSFNSAAGDDSHQTGQKGGGGLAGLPGGRKAIAAFTLSLVAYTIQTEFAQHVQQTLNYKKPFLSLYIGHSSFTIILPAHLLLLKLTTGRSIRKHYLHLITENLRWQTETQSLFGQKQSGGEAQGLLHGRDRNSRASESKVTAYLKDTCGFDLGTFIGILGILTIGITVPALSWYAAVPMTSMADITALYNCFAVAALVFSVWFLGDRWEYYKVISVLLAVGGVVIVSYGGAEHKKTPRPVDPVKGKPDTESAANEFPHPLLGDMLALSGAVTMGLYEICFKLIGTLPDEDLQARLYGQAMTRRRSGDRRRTSSHQSYIEYRPVSGMEQQEEGEAFEQNKLSGTDYQATGISQPSSRRQSEDGNEDANKHKNEQPSKGPTTYTIEAESSSSSESELDDADLEELGAGGTTRLSRTTSQTNLKHHQMPSSSSGSGPRRILNDVPAPLPFGMHANLMTSGIGLFTFLTLWVGVVIAAYLGWEPFEWPHNFETVVSIAIVAICGVFFNACFMILLSIWGPVLASVSCLLTTVLVEIADILLGRPLKLLSLAGCAFIGFGFVVLIYGESRARSHHPAHVAWKDLA